METLVLDGKRYVKAAKAASDLGYTSDYVGQLCRSGQVRAHLVGRTWYVDEEQLSTHRVEKKRNARVKAREQAKKTLAEYRAVTVTQSSKKPARGVPIRYEEDQADLLPVVRKLAVATPAVQSAARSKVATNSVHSSKPEPAYEIENPGEKVIMQGKLKLIDLNDGELFADENTVVMVPRINRKVVRPATRERQQESIIPTEELYVDDEYTEEHDVEYKESVVQTDDAPRHTTFTDRMRAEGVTLEDDGDGPRLAQETDAYEEVALAHDEEVVDTPPVRVVMPILFVTLLLIITGSTLALERTADYFENSRGIVLFETGYTVDFKQLLSEIRSKI